MRILLVALAGAAGALSRYGVGLLVGAHPFPWSTLAVNVAGSFLLGLVLTAGPARLPGDVVVAATTGFLGAFTTFSTFTFETQLLLREGRPTTAAGYVAASLVAGLAAAFVGVAVGRRLPG